MNIDSTSRIAESASRHAYVHGINRAISSVEIHIDEIRVAPREDIHKILDDIRRALISRADSIRVEFTAHELTPTQVE
jgi:hypothetical protein